MEVITLETKAYQDLIKEIESIRGYLEEFKEQLDDILKELRITKKKL